MVSLAPELRRNLWPKFTSLIEKGEPIPFFGDGTSERDYTYYTDIIDGVVAAIDRDLGFEIINLGEARTTSLSQLVKLIEQEQNAVRLEAAGLRVKPATLARWRKGLADAAQALRDGKGEDARKAIDGAIRDPRKE